MGEADEEVQRSQGEEVGLLCGFVSCWPIDLPTETDSLNTANFPMPGVPPVTFSVLNRHCLPTYSSPCSPRISGDISESSN